LGSPRLNFDEEAREICEREGLRFVDVIGEDDKDDSYEDTLDL